MENGEAKVGITGYTGQSLELSVDSGKGALVATSVTAWPGWRLTLDGKEWPLLRFNRAFLAFEAPSGKHSAVLRYWPRSFTWGLAISSASLLAALVVLAKPRRRGSASTRGRGAA